MQDRAVQGKCNAERCRAKRAIIDLERDRALSMHCPSKLFRSIVRETTANQEIARLQTINNQLSAQLDALAKGSLSRHLTIFVWVLLRYSKFVSYGLKTEPSYYCDHISCKNLVPLSIRSNNTRPAKSRRRERSKRPQKRHLPLSRQHTYPRGRSGYSIRPCS